MECMTELENNRNKWKHRLPDYNTFTQSRSSGDREVAQIASIHTYAGCVGMMSCIVAGRTSGQAS